MKESTEDIATLMVMILTKSNDLSRFMKEYGIEKENERMRNVLRIKDSKNTWSFGGLTIYGSLIGVACEKFHWSMDYVVWGISYNNLRLLLADSVQTITLSDKEARRVHIPNDNNSERINGDDKEAMNEFIKSNFK